MEVREKVEEVVEKRSKRQRGRGGGGATAATIQHFSNTSPDTLTGAGEKMFDWRFLTGGSKP